MPRAVVLLSFLLTTTAALLSVNVSRLKGHIATLATHNDLVAPSVQRILYTPSDVSARTYLKSLFSEAGLTIREDAVGNIFATWPGTEPRGVLTGSHFDAIPNSGMFDGTLGILAALEAVTALQEAGYKPRRSITILAFTSEEPTRFALSCIGSRLLAGAIQPDRLSQLKDASGIAFDAARFAAGYTGDVAKVPLMAGEYTAFVELHSEQGPILEDTRTDIGAVTAIAAPAALSVTYTGPGGHAGTTLMSSRRDPSLAAATLSLGVERAVERIGGKDTVGTTGFIEITPNAVNSVPTMAKVGIDIRDIDQERRDKVLATVESLARIIAKTRDVGVDVVVNSRDPPATCNDSVVQAVVDTAKDHKLSYRKMVSRAYHDALFMAGVIPTGMIFVPCRGGISHRPDEFVTDRDMENGVKVLAGVLKRLAGNADGVERNGPMGEGRKPQVLTGEEVELSVSPGEEAVDVAAKAREAATTESGKEGGDSSEVIDQKAIETQIAADTDYLKGSESSRRNGSKRKTPSAAGTAKGTGRLKPRKGTGQNKRKTSQSSESKASTIVEGDGLDSATMQQTMEPVATESEGMETGAAGAPETMKQEEPNDEESAKQEVITSGTDSSLESMEPRATEKDTELSEKGSTRNAEEPNKAESVEKDADSSDTQKATETARKAAERSRTGKGTASNASKMGDSRNGEKPGSTTQETDYTRKIEGGDSVPDIKIEGFDKPKTNFEDEKDEV